MLSTPISHFTKASSKYVKGYQLFDKVKIPDGREGFIFGRRSKRAKKRGSNFRFKRFFKDASGQTSCK